jgi:zinc/manganese transport system ATP-binding protein
VSAPQHDPAAIELDGAAVQLGGRTVWSEVSMRMGRGEFVALLGANGSGKSTLLKVVLGALALSAGRASVLGRPPGKASRSIGYLPQRRAFDAGMRLRGRDIVRLGLDGDRWGLPLPARWARAGAQAAAAGQRVQEAIAMVGAESYAERAIGECSGGEQQRLLIAQALIARPELFLLDEPLDSLDLPNQAAVAALVHTLCREAGVAVLLVAHDINPLLPYVDRVVYLAGGRAASGPADQVIQAEVLSRLYGHHVDVLHVHGRVLVVAGTEDGEGADLTADHALEAG